MDQIINIFFSDIFDAEVVDDKEKSDVTRHMLPEGGGAGDRRTSKLGEIDFEPFIGNAAGLFETWNAFADMHLDTSVRAYKTVQVVFLNDLVWEEIQGKFHVLVSVHGDAVVEIFDVQSHKPGIRG